MRWILRYASYLAIMAIVGILLTTAYVWSGAGSHPLLRRILSRSLFATAVLGFLQLLVVASDISGDAPWSSFGSIDAATTTDAGMAFAIRIVLALALWIVLFQYRIVHADVYWTAVSLPGLGLLATWAFAGHSRSMRWPAIGVATDVAHHAAAAAWIAGLAIVGWIVIPKTQPDVLVPAVRRFSRVAAISVAVLVVTGLVQTVRLVGNPFDLLDANHGRYLVAKVVVLAAMLGIANANRRRVDHRLDDPDRASRHIGALRQAVVAEFAIGLIIVGITAAMVVSPPASSQTETGAPLNSRSTSILHNVVVVPERPPQMIRRLAAPAIALALTATLAACGSDDHSSMADTTTATQAPGGSTRDRHPQRRRHRVRPRHDRPPRAGHRDGRDRARPQQSAPAPKFSTSPPGSRAPRTPRSS